MGPLLTLAVACKTTRQVIAANSSVAPPYPRRDDDLHPACRCIEATAAGDDAPLLLTTDTSRSYQVAEMKRQMPLAVDSPSAAQVHALTYPGGREVAILVAKPVASAAVAGRSKARLVTTHLQEPLLTNHGDGLYGTSTAAALYTQTEILGEWT